MRTALVALTALLLLVAGTPAAPAADPPSATVLVSTGQAAYSYGARITLTVRLFGPTVNTAVRVYAKPDGRAEQLIAARDVDPSTHRLALGVQVRRNTVYRAVFDGDSSWGAAEGRTRVEVRAGLRLRSPSRSMTGRFHRLPAGAAVVTATVTAAPAPPSGCVRVVRYRLVGDRWRHLDTTACRVRDAANEVRIRVPGFPPGTRVRVAARFGSSTSNTPSPVRWYYVLLT